MHAPKSIVELDDVGPRRSINFQIRHHLLAPKRPPFIKDCVREQRSPLARVGVGSDELQMMPRIRLMCGRE